MSIRACLLVTLAICGFESVQACQITPGVKAATEEEKRAHAEFIFVGKIVSVRAAPELEKITQHPYTFLFTMEVEKWEKGRLTPPLLVVDTTGTDCDSQLGIFRLTDQLTHERLLREPSLPRRIYMRKHEGHLLVISADEPK